jgi:hypothetical protein
MNTAVQLRPIGARELPRCDLVSGAPHALVAGELGPIALFGPGQLVAFRVRHLRSARLYVFRTLHTNEALTSNVTGVRPRVQLLIHLRSARRVRLARRLFAYLARTVHDPSALSDAFYVRVAAALGGRLPALKILLSLVARELLSGQAMPRPPPRRSPGKCAADLGGFQ